MRVLLFSHIVKNRRTDAASWGAFVGMICFVGMIWMFGYCATLIPLWFYFTAQSTSNRMLKFFRIVAQVDQAFSTSHRALRRWRMREALRCQTFESVSRRLHCENLFGRC